MKKYILKFLCEYPIATILVSISLMILLGYKIIKETIEDYKKENYV